MNLPIVKSFSVGDGDMYYIRHGSDNFTIIDCCLDADNAARIVGELVEMRKGKGITRFVSTHPDDDHIRGLRYLDEQLQLLNFYCVENSATKPRERWTPDFGHYCSLRDSKKAFRLFRGCKRRWMNQTTNERGSAGITIHWPNRGNPLFKEELARAASGKEANNICPILTYRVVNGPQFMWMGDLETEFLHDIENDLRLPKVDVLFAPHHGRNSGTVPTSMLDKIAPQIVVVGEAPAEHLNYYAGCCTITQNSAGDITFLCDGTLVHIFSSEAEYVTDFLSDHRLSDSLGFYLGTLSARGR